MKNLLANRKKVPKFLFIIHEENLILVDNGTLEVDKLYQLKHFCFIHFIVEKLLKIFRSMIDEKVPNKIHNK